MKRRKNFLTSKILFSLTFVFAFIFIIFEIMTSCGIHLFLGFTQSGKISPSIGFTSLVLLIFSINSLLLPYLKDKRFIKFTIMFSSVILIIVLLFYLILFSYCAFLFNYYEFTSEDGEHQIVIEEGALLLVSSGTVYEKASGGLMYELGEYSTDDGFRAVGRGNYYFVWGKDSFVFAYDFGLGNHPVYKELELEYLN